MTQQPSRVVQENIDALVQREVAGRIEHGDDMDRTDFPVDKWLSELISENLDSANYGRKLQHMMPKLLAAAKLLQAMGYTWSSWTGEWAADCTCPSGDGSLRWPCPMHPVPHVHSVRLIGGNGMLEHAALHAADGRLIKNLPFDDRRESSAERSGQPRVVKGKDYMHATHGLCRLIGPDPEDGALLILEHVGNDEDLMTYFSCESSDLYEVGEKLQ